MIRWALVSILATLLAACGDDGGAATDAMGTIDSAVPDAPGPDANTTTPTSLRDTGLYSDFENEVLAPNVMAFEPRYPLWTDGATKRRWIYLPPGTQIDTSDMDYWVFPQGTKLWKEFTRDGTRVETRLIYKNGPTTDDWYMMAYAWNTEQTEAVAVEDGMANALGTQHDIPNTADCANCHGKMNDRALGFGAIQLSHSNGGLTLSQLSGDGWLTTAPAKAGYTIPGDATVEPALGYLHGNCGGCHHANSPLLAAIPMRLRISINDSDTAMTGPYQTAVCVPPTVAIPDQTSIVEGGLPSASAMHYRMNIRTPQQMPPVGTEMVDTTALAAIDAWISSLPTCPPPK